MTTQTLPAVDHRGPVTGKERALAPDLIRGAMLLLIGLANSANFAFAGQPGVESTPHGLERLLNFLKLIRAMAALGQRSMSGYLFQSLCWMVLLAPFTLDLQLGSTAYTAALIAIGVWVVSVIGAYAMSLRGYRGPAETLLRRLVY